MRNAWSLPLAAACVALVALPLRAQQRTPFLVGPSDSGVVLRWIWPEGTIRPQGYFIDRQPAAGGAWTRLTPRPLTRIRDRARARALLGTAYPRYESLLFPTDPAAVFNTVQNYTGVLLLDADVDARFATALGLRFEDTTAVAAAFVYRLVALTGSGERVLATSAPVVPRAYRPATAPDSLVVRQYRSAIGLRWSRQMRFTAYNVYRSIDGRPFVQVNDGPVVLFTDATPIGTEASPIYYLDVAGVPGDTVRYAIAGIDPFGRRSARSAPVKVVLADITPPGTPVNLRAAVIGDTIALTWVPPTDTDVQSYRVARAPADTGPYTELDIPLVQGDSTARIRGVPAGRVFWYRLTAVDRTGNVSTPSPSVVAEVPDLTPPPVPTAVAGTADSGLVRLSWHPSVAADLRGYRIYRASVAGGDFGLLTEDPVTATGYTDTVPRRARHAFYYRVTAVDSAYNESAPSDTAIVRPPDRTPPSAPLATVVPGEDLLVVTWLRNPEPDVAGYLVRWRVQGDTTWQVGRRTVGAAQLADTLADVPPRRLVEVQVFAVDSAANISVPSRTAVGEAYHRVAPAAPELRDAKFDVHEHGVVLTWHVPDRPPAHVRVVRRDAGSGAVFRIIADVPGAAGHFVDATARAGRRYEYRLDAEDAYDNVGTGKRTRAVDVPRAGR